jgi:hypothetical protein
MESPACVARRSSHQKRAMAALMMVMVALMMVARMVALTTLVMEAIEALRA